MFSRVLEASMDMSRHRQEPTDCSNSPCSRSLHTGPLIRFQRHGYSSLMAMVIWLILMIQYGTITCALLIDNAKALDSLLLTIKQRQTIIDTMDKELFG